MYSWRRGVYFSTPSWISTARAWRKIISAGKISFFGRAFLVERCAETGKGCVSMYGCPQGMKILPDLQGMAGVKAVWQQNLGVHRLQVELSHVGEMISWFAFLFLCHAVPSSCGLTRAVLESEEIYESRVWVLSSLCIEVYKGLTSL